MRIYPSARAIGWGIVLILVGSAVAIFGFANPPLSLFGPSRTSPLVFIGGIASLVGWAFLGWGVYAAATSLDYLAKRAHTEDTI